MRMHDVLYSAIISISVLIGIVIITLITITMVIAAARVVFIKRKINSCHASAHVYVTPDSVHDLPIWSRASEEQDSVIIISNILLRTFFFFILNNI